MCIIFIDSFFWVWCESIDFWQWDVWSLSAQGTQKWILQWSFFIFISVCLYLCNHLYWRHKRVGILHLNLSGMVDVISLFGFSTSVVSLCVLGVLLIVWLVFFRVWFFWLVISLFMLYFLLMLLLGLFLLSGTLLMLWLAYIYHLLFVWVLTVFNVD